MQTALLIIISIVATISFGLMFLYSFARIHQSLFGRTKFNDGLEVWVITTVDYIFSYFRIY